jgi:hypothetical protein
MTKTWWEAPMGGSVLSFLKQNERLVTQAQPTEPLVCNLQSRMRIHAILVIHVGLYELLGNPTT